MVSAAVAIANINVERTAASRPTLVGVDFGDFSGDVARREVRDGLAEARKHFGDDLPVGFALPARLNGLLEVLYAAFDIGKASVLFDVGAGRQEDVSRFTGFTLEDVLHDQERHLVDSASGQILIRVLRDDVDAHQVESLDLTLGGGFENALRVQA